MHSSNLLAPIVVVQLADGGIPIAPFLIAPMCDPNPGAIDRSRRANLRGQDFEIACHANRSGSAGRDENENVMTCPLFGGVPIINVPIATGPHFHCLLMEQGGWCFLVKIEREGILAVRVAV